MSLKRVRVQSWIPPSFSWTIATDLFGIRVSMDDPDVIEFVATGERWVDLHRNQELATAKALLLGADRLDGQLEAAAWTVRRFREDRRNGSAKALVRCDGVFVLPGGNELLVLVGTNPALKARCGLSRTTSQDIRASAS